MLYQWTSSYLANYGAGRIIVAASSVEDARRTAENLRADYTSVDFDGVEYWVRN